MYVLWKPWEEMPDGSQLHRHWPEGNSGCMVLVSTHMIDSMEELWDTTYIMKQGRVAAVVERENLKDNNKSLEDIFFEITEGAALEREV